MRIRPATKDDSDAIWAILASVVKGGDAFTFDPEMSREEGLDYWFQRGAHPYVAVDDSLAAGERIVGSYLSKPNQPGLGSHVANAAYMVSPSARGHGAGRAMGEHSIGEARRLGFRAMQFNFVVSTNAPAVRLWKDLGFEIVGTLPGAFRHLERGYVDAYVMFCSVAD